MYYRKDDHLVTSDIEKEGYTSTVPLAGVPYQKFNDTSRTWEVMADMEILRIADSENSRLLDEIAASDYKVLKTIRLKLYEMIENLYPGLTSWYKTQTARLNEIQRVRGVT